MSESYKFKAFISYKHGELDSIIAARLQRSLEHFAVPPAIAKSTGHKKVGRIFRDVEELASSSDLFTQLAENIKHAEFLIVICSPRSRNAKWVHKEIETFLQYHDRTHILAVLIQGEPDEAFPPQLLEEGEPLAFDLRADTTRGSLKLCKKNLPRLVAPLIGCSYDDIYNRTRIYRMQRITAVSALLFAASVAVGITLWNKNAEITRNYTAKLENQSRYLANTSSDLLASGDRESALLVALAALPDADNDRPYVAQARIALANAMYLYQNGGAVNFRPEKILEHEGELQDISAYSYDENLLLSVDNLYTVYVWDADTLELKWKFDPEGEDQYYERAYFPGNGTVILCNSTRTDCYDMTGSAPLWSFELPVCSSLHAENYTQGPEPTFALDAEAGLLYVSPAFWCVERNADNQLDICEPHRLCIIDISDGSVSEWRPESWYDGKRTTDLGYGRDICLSNDGEYCGMIVQRNTIDDPYNYATDFMVFTPGDALAEFSTIIENCAGQAQIIAIQDGLAVIAVFDEYSAIPVSGAYQKAKFTVYGYDLNSGNLLYSCSDSAYYDGSLPEISGGICTLTRGDTLLLRCGNMTLSLDPKTGEVLQRIESETMQVGSVTFSSGVSLMFHSDGTVQARSLVSTYFPSEVYSGYHRDLKISNVIKELHIGNRIFLYAGNDIYCYSAPSDESYLYDTDLVPSTSAFSPSGRICALLSSSQNCISIINCASGEEMFRDDAYCEYGSYDGMLLWVNDTVVAYFAPDGNAVRLYNTANDTVTEIPLEFPDEYAVPMFGQSAGNGRFAVYYDFSCDWSLNTSRLDLTAALILDENGSVLRSFTVDEIYSRRSDIDSNGQGKLFAATVSQDGRYVLIPNSLSVGEAEEADTALLIYDMESECYIPLSSDITGIRNNKVLYRYAGWISSSSDELVFMESDNEFTVISMVDGSIRNRCCVDNLDGNELCFTPDGGSIVYQDSDMRVHIHDIVNDRETYASRDALTGWATFRFYENGKYLTARSTHDGSTPTTTVYELKDGIYEEVDSISFCYDLDMEYLLTSNSLDCTRIYRYLSIDEMITKAREILNGRELTDVDKQTYLIN